MSDIFLNLLFASLIFWSCFLLCDLSLKRTSSGLCVYMIIVGIFAIDCAAFYYTSFSSLPYAWYLFALIPILVLPFLYRNQLTTIIFTFMSSLLFSFMLQTIMKIVTYVIYLNYPAFYVQLDSSSILMIAMCVYLILILVLLRFVFKKIAKQSSSRAMLLTWIYPILCLGILIYNDYFDTLYTSTIIRYMSAILIVMLAVYILFYRMLTNKHTDSMQQVYNQKDSGKLLPYEKQYFEAIINSYNDLLDRSFVIEKGLHSMQRMIRDNNFNEALRVLDQIHDSMEDIQLFNITENINIDTLLSYYHYIFAQDNLKLHLDIQLPQNNPIHDLELCILFGGLLQNAYDTLYECQAEQGEVLLECKTQDRVFLITCSNTVTKKDRTIQREPSNFNLKCVKEVCDIHKGTMQIECSKNIFYVYVDIAI